MKEITRIVLPEEIVTYLQMLIYERDGLKLLNCQIIQNDTMDNLVSNERYQDYLKQYKESCISFQIAFNEVIKEYVPIEYQTKDYNVDVSFISEELIVSTGKEV